MGGVWEVIAHLRMADRLQFVATVAGGCLEWVCAIVDANAAEVQKLWHHLAVATGCIAVASVAKDSTRNWRHRSAADSVTLPDELSYHIQCC